MSTKKTQPKKNDGKAPAAPAATTAKHQIRENTAKNLARLKGK